MTTRLENAIKQLTPAELQQLEEFAEEMARRHQPGPPQFLKLDWAGKLDLPYESGLEAQEAMKKERLEEMERKLRS